VQDNAECLGSLECSAWTALNIKKIFDTVITSTYRKRFRKRQLEQQQQQQQQDSTDEDKQVDNISVGDIDEQAPRQPPEASCDAATFKEAQEIAAYQPELEQLLHGMDPTSSVHSLVSKLLQYTKDKSLVVAAHASQPAAQTQQHVTTVTDGDEQSTSE
jgi:hypothetical protein